MPEKQDIERAKKNIKEELFLDDSIINEIVLNLMSGRHILLAGPVGCGKTHLALRISELIWKNFGGYSRIVTATSEWTSFDVIGGIIPVTDKDGNRITYEFQDGCVTKSIKDNWNMHKAVDGNHRGVWLVIDEFNRANIDKAFGDLFTSLEYGTLTIPSYANNGSGAITIPKDYRIIATMNTFDKSFLFKMSDALKRRFAFEMYPDFLSNTFNEEEEKYYVLKRS